MNKHDAIYAAEMACIEAVYAAKTARREAISAAAKARREAIYAAATTENEAVYAAGMVCVEAVYAAKIELRRVTMRIEARAQRAANIDSYNRRMSKRPVALRPAPRWRR